MVKLIFYFNIAFLIILTTLGDANGVPIRLIPRTKNHITTAQTQKAGSLGWNLNQENTKNGYFATLKKKLKLDPGQQPRQLAKNDDFEKNVTENATDTKIQSTNLTTLAINDIKKRIRPSKIRINYYTASKLSTVCFRISSIYNKPEVRKWLRTEINNNWDAWLGPYQQHRSRYFIGLRRELFNQGRSEECHTRKYNENLPYLECALKRNQRMEYLVPMYPLHQVYFRHLTTIYERDIYN